MNLEIVADQDFHGCISIRTNNETLFEKAYGYADLANQLPNTLSTRFPTASAGKVFVAVGILQLIEKGRLQLDHTIGELLDFKWHAIDPAITVEQLITHTSGIPDYFDESTMEEYAELWRDYPNYKIRKNADLLPLFMHKPMMYPRGARFQYNNTGFVVLGLIIEKIAGLPFDAYLDNHIFSACGMHHTGYYELDRLPANCANAYIHDETKNQYYTNIYSVDAKGTGAGGAFTTIGDIERFWLALMSYKVLSPELTKRMLSKQSGSDQDGYYGYGIWLRKKPDNTYTPYFQGYDPGVSFVTSYEKNTSITLVSNFGCDVWEMQRSIQARLDAK